MAGGRTPAYGGGGGATVNPYADGSRTAYGGLGGVSFLRLPLCRWLARKLTHQSGHLPGILRREQHMEDLQMIHSRHHARRHMNPQLEHQPTDPHQPTTMIHTHPSINLLLIRGSVIRGVIELLMTRPHLRQHQHPQPLVLGRMERLTAYQRQQQRQQHRMVGRLRHRTAGSRRRQDGVPERMFRGMKRGRQARKSQATGMRLMSRSERQGDRDDHEGLQLDGILSAMCLILRGGSKTGWSTWSITRRLGRGKFAIFIIQVPEC